MFACTMVICYLLISLNPSQSLQSVSTRLQIRQSLMSGDNKITSNLHRAGTLLSRRIHLEKQRAPLMMSVQGQYTSFWGIFVTGLQFAGPIFFLSLQFSSVLTAMEISKVKSCGLLSPLPFISLFTNSFVWSLYGFLKMDGTVFIPNTCGVLASLYCILAFHKHTENKPNKLYIVSLVISTIALFLTATGHTSLIGVLGCSLSVLLSGSPLAVMKTVIQERSTTALPFTTSFVIWLNSISWLLYGSLVAHDILIYGPNIIGFILASVQMSLFAIYGIKPAERKSEMVSKI
jgi:solute carrier family 50 (sugar transporter)